MFVDEPEVIEQAVDGKPGDTRVGTVVEDDYDLYLIVLMLNKGGAKLLMFFVCLLFIIIGTR